MAVGIRRRKFITALGGATVAWPLAIRAQSERMRRVGILINLNNDDPEAKRRIKAFATTLSELGWTEGKNLHIDYRLGGVQDIVRKNAAELVALAPDVIVANAAPSVQALQMVTHTIPVVFTAVIDPVALGFVQSLARPGGNVTGFTPFEFGLAAKWLELLKEIAPGVKQVGVLAGGSAVPTTAPQLAAIQAAAPSLEVELTVIDISDKGKIERGIVAFAGSADRGLIVIRTFENIVAGDLIIALAARYRLPTVYPLRFFVAAGGLASYGPNDVAEYRQVAGYVDRILKGEKPANLPVQQPTKFDLVINLKTAQTLGLTVPPSLLATADEVIE
jgi:putative tryptophan/tyrosine transport system substrate-binding protein